MRERFEGANEPRLIEALKRQEFTGGNADIVAAFRSVGELVDFPKGEKFIAQDGEDNDIYMLVSGSVAIVVNGNQVATRLAGQHVGEMAAIEPAQKRAADVVALDTIVALKVSSADFGKAGESFPQIWKPIAQELSRRLLRRNDLIPPPNESPKLFIISSAEALAVANQIQAGLQHDVPSTVWTNGVFFAGGYPLETLEAAVEASDFAVAIAQPDDIVDSRGTRSHTLRDNVVFELGLFMGKLTRHRTVLVHPKTDDLKLPSDLHGLTMASYLPGKPEDLAARLGPACTQIRAIVARLGVRKFIS
jgi:CRP/FNR family cyclic AMP-dependent transcriptional regulator